MTRTCTVPGCPRKHKARGYCHLHLSRLNRTGSLADPRRIRASCGTRSRYVAGCRCDECRWAARIYMRTRRLRQVWGPIFEQYLSQSA